MRCPFCGNDVPDEYKFCSRCGNQLPAPMIVDPEPPKKKKTGLIVGLSIGGVILAAVIALVVLSLTGVFDVLSFLRKPPEIETVRVNLNNYLSAEFSGYEGQGTAEVVFDEETFIKDYAGKIVVIEDFLAEAKSRRSNEENSDEAPDDRGVKALLKEISFEAAPLKELKNSDTVSVTWNLKPEELEEIYNIHLVSSDTVFTVEGLTVITEIDPFEGVVITYEGISPNITASFSLSGVDESCRKIIFSPDKTTQLKNGDIITVTITNYDEETMKAEFGKALTTTTKQYTVESSSSYVLNASELAGLDLTEFDTNSQTYVTDFWQSISLSDMPVTSCTRVGTYFLTNQSPLPDSSEYDFNALCAIYEIHASYSYYPFVDSDSPGIYSAPPVTQDYLLYFATYVPNLTVTEGVIQIPYEYMEAYEHGVQFANGYRAFGDKTKESLFAAFSTNNPAFRATELSTGEVIEAVSSDQNKIRSYSPDGDTSDTFISPNPPAAAAISLPSVNTALPDAAHFSEGTTEMTFQNYTFSLPSSAVVYPEEAFTSNDSDQMFYMDDYTIVLRFNHTSFDVDIAAYHSLIRDIAIESMSVGTDEGVTFDIYQYQEVVNPNNVPIEISRVKIIGDTNFPNQDTVYAIVYDDVNQSATIFNLSILSTEDDTLEYSADFAAILNSIKK